LNSILQRKSAQLCIYGKESDNYVENDLPKKDNVFGIEVADTSFTAHIFLRWGYQKGFGLIPKSKHPERIKQNFEILHKFSLDEEEMNLIDSIYIETIKEDRRCKSDGEVVQSSNSKICWDSANIL
jgi:diketogulonate reductase-like aldo/keto reductase